MAIDRYEDDRPATAVGADCAAEGIDVEKFAADEIPAPDGKRDSPQASDEPSDPGSGIVDREDRIAYHLEYREVVEAELLSAARERWHAAKPALEAQWHEHARAHPARVDVSATLDDAAITKVKKGCDRIAETEENIVTPALLRIEAADPERHLVGLEHRRKGHDRIMEKIGKQIEAQADLTPEEALASVKDAVRYPFQYTEERYSEGVHADVDRLKAAGFELVELRNSWKHEEYKGINSRWEIPDNGQLFEVQFHTRISFEAKQLTHQAYERLRIPATPKVERDELEDFQRRVNGNVPVPHGAPNYPDYP
jgi:hypothetical protein